MLRNVLTPLLAAGALTLAASPAFAGPETRAQEAIAAAQAKVYTAESLGAGVELPEQAAEARAALAMAREHFAADRNTEATMAAIRASEIADAQIGKLRQDNQQALANERANAELASQQAALAQQQAEEAKARATFAERAAASSAAQAQAARNALAAVEAAQDEKR